MIMYHLYETYIYETYLFHVCFICYMYDIHEPYMTSNLQRFEKFQPLIYMTCMKKSYLNHCVLGLHRYTGIPKPYLILSYQKQVCNFGSFLAHFLGFSSLVCREST